MGNLPPYEPPLPAQGGPNLGFSQPGEAVAVGRQCLVQPLERQPDRGALGADVEMVRLGELPNVGAERDVDQVIAPDRGGRLLLAAIGKSDCDGDIAAAG